MWQLELKWKTDFSLESRDVRLEIEATFVFRDTNSGAESRRVLHIIQLSATRRAIAEVPSLAQNARSKSLCLLCKVTSPIRVISVRPCNSSTNLPRFRQRDEFKIYAFGRLELSGCFLKRRRTA